MCPSWATGCVQEVISFRSDFILGTGGPVLNFENQGPDQLVLRSETDRFFFIFFPPQQERVINLNILTEMTINKESL